MQFSGLPRIQPEAFELNKWMLIFLRLSREASNATAREELVSTYCNIKLLSEEALTQFEEYTTRTRAKKQEGLKEYRR